VLEAGLVVVGQEPAASGQQARVFLPQHRFADHEGPLAERAASSTAATMPVYPVQRQRFPLIACAISSRDGRRWSGSQRAS